MDTEKTSQPEEELLLASNHPKKRAGRKKFKETRHPVYRGVRQRNSDRWVCQLREPIKQKRIWLGTYPTPEMAARAHDVAAIALRGHMACLNFADSVWRLPVPASNDPVDLRKAAMEGAEAFRPTVGKVALGSDIIENVVASEETSRMEAFDVDVFSISSEYDYSGEADGALMSPPPLYGGNISWDEVESDAEVELWSY